jgi:hypothetical protein
MITKATILRSLTTNPRAVQKALVGLYLRQTADEQSSRTTRHTNGRGFNHYHAKEGSRLARLIISGVGLTPGELSKGREIACYYAGTQLLEAAKLKAARKLDDLRLANHLAKVDPFQKTVGVGFLL